MEGIDRNNKLLQNDGGLISKKKTKKAAPAHASRVGEGLRHTPNKSYLTIPQTKAI